MRQPQARGTAIDADRIEGWLAEFTGFRENITLYHVNRWLGQFRDGDKDLAARVLDCVDFFTEARITNGLRDALSCLHGWHKDGNRRTGRWAFVAFTGSSGESGDSMLYKFRLANGLDARRYDTLFLYRRDLVGLNLGSDDTIVFVDDFSGTGDAAIQFWNGQYRELLSGEPNIYLVLVAASTAAIRSVKNETPLTIVTTIRLNDRDNMFSERCRHFTDEEKEALQSYCQRASRQLPHGYGNCGFVVVFAHRCPNNSIPILHAKHNRWRGLFPRNL